MKSKKIVILLLVITVLLTVLVGISLYDLKSKDRINNDEEKIGNYFSNELQDESEREILQEKIDDERILKNVSNRNDFYTVKTSINKFYEYYILLFNNQGNKDLENTCKGILYSMLDKNYIKYKKIDTDNISNKLQKITDATINIEDIYFRNINDKISTYIVKGILNDKINNKQSKLFMIVNIDKQNGTFKVLLDDYVKEKYPNIKVGDTFDFATEDNIKNEEYNVFEYKNITDEEYVTDLFNKLRDDFVYNQETLYNRLNLEYRNNKFGTKNEFKEYLENVVYKNLTMKIDKYNKYVYDDYTQYVCIDKNGKYYIFNEKAICDYEIILDTYTIDLPEFIEKYNKANEQTKIGMNIQKIIDAINEKDYKYVYNKLNSTFKDNNFSDITRLKQYLNKNLYDSNKIEYKTFKEEGNNYIYIIDIINNENINQSKTLTIIMKLNEGTDFEMSFNIK